MYMKISLSDLVANIVILPMSTLSAACTGKQSRNKLSKLMGFDS